MAIYVLYDRDTGPVVAHTTEQGATERMADFPEGQQSYLTVKPIELVDDRDP